MKKINKVLSGLLIGATVLTSGAIVMAADTKTAAGKNNLQGRPAITGKIAKEGNKGRGTSEKSVMKNNMEDMLKSLVSAGVITQDESDKILVLSKKESEARQAELDKVKNMTGDERKAYLASVKENNPEKKGDIFAQAVSNGIITQAKADTVRVKLQEFRDIEKRAKMSEELKGLVTVGTITQLQADRIIAYVNTLEANKTTPGTKPTDAEKKEKKRPLSTLVDDGTLTKEQHDAVSKVLSIGKSYGHGSHGMDRTTRAAVNTADSNTTK